MLIKCLYSDYMIACESASLIISIPKFYKIRSELLLLSHSPFVFRYTWNIDIAMTIMSKSLVQVYS